MNAFPEYVEVGFNKHGQTGVAIFSRIHGTDEWTKIGTVERSPYKDTRPPAVAGKAEVREYMARCYSQNECIGQNSETRVVMFGGYVTGITLWHLISPSLFIETGRYKMKKASLSFYKHGDAFSIYIFWN